MLPIISTESATDANLSDIAESGYLADQPEKIFPIYSATSLFTNLLSPSYDIPVSIIWGLYMKETAIEPQLTIEELEVRNISSFSHIYPTWMRYVYNNIT